jgi:hypothetical protein
LPTQYTRCTGKQASRPCIATDTGGIGGKIKSGINTLSWGPDIAQQGIPDSARDISVYTAIPSKAPA